MKLIIFLISITISGLIFLNKADKSYEGTWLMEQGDNSNPSPVLRINMKEGIWEGRLDVPQQEVYDRKVHSIRVDGDSVFITVYKNGPVIYARQINGSFISGVTRGEGRVDTVKFKKM